MLCVLMALDHYENLYAAIPSKIKASTDQTLAGLQRAIDIQAKASVESVQASLIDSVSIAAQRVAKEVAKKQRVQWVCGAIIVTSLVAGTIGWYFHKMGRDDGYKQCTAPKSTGKRCTRQSNQKQSAGFRSTQLAHLNSSVRLVRHWTPIILMSVVALQLWLMTY